MAESVLKDKAKTFAKAIVLLCREIKATHKESVLTNQLLRSGTSIGANLHEAQYAQGTKDFISKFEIALKECHETEYWLKLFVKTSIISADIYSKLSNDSGKIRRILISSINTAKSNS
jgi:four helix bundle protein